MTNPTDLTPASEARKAIALVVRRYVPEQDWASAGLELRDPLEALQAAARASERDRIYGILGQQAALEDARWEAVNAASEALAAPAEPHSFTFDHEAATCPGCYIHAAPPAEPLHPVIEADMRARPEVYTVPALLDHIGSLNATIKNMAEPSE